MSIYKKMRSLAQFASVSIGIICGSAVASSVIQEEAARRGYYAVGGEWIAVGVAAYVGYKLSRAVMCAAIKAYAGHVYRREVLKDGNMR